MSSRSPLRTLYCLLVLMTLASLTVVAASTASAQNVTTPTLAIDTVTDPSVTPVTNHTQMEWCLASDDNLRECTPQMLYEGAAFVHVNGMPVPFYTLDYGIVGCDYVNTSGDCQQTGNQIVTGATRWGGEFIPQYLRVGSNLFEFNITSASAQTGEENNRNVNQWHKITFLYHHLKERLFTIHRVGSSFQGATLRNLALEDIDPNLARQLEILEAAIERDIDALRSTEDPLNSAQRNYRNRIRLEALKGELNGILESGFDSITHDGLAALLAEYSDVLSESTRSALVDFLDSLHAQVTQLQEELQTVIEDTRAHVEAIEYAINEELESPDLDDPSQYSLNLDSASVSEVEPALDDQETDDSEIFPYDAHANLVIAQLESTTSAGMVTDRQAFMDIVASWYQYQAATGRLLSERQYVSMQETGAFQTAVSRVRSSITPYFDLESGFFKDLLVSQSVKNTVNGPLSRFNPAATNDLKRGLNLWRDDVTGGGMTASQVLLSDTIGALGALVESYEMYPDADPLGEVFVSLNRLLNGIATVAHAVAETSMDIAISTLPFVGDYRDFCEMVSGRKFCVPHGELLTSADRIFAGMGVLVGSRIFWEGVSSTAGGFIVTYKNVMAEVADALHHGRRPLDRMREVLDSLHGLPGGFPNHMASSDTALKTANGTYKPIDFVYLDEAFDSQGRFQFTFRASGVDGYPTNWDEVAEWTYIVEPGTHRVRVAPRGASHRHRQSHAQLAGTGTGVQAEGVRAMMAGKMDIDPNSKFLLGADTHSGHFHPEGDWVPDYMAAVFGAHGLDPRTPFKKYNKQTERFDPVPSIPEQ